MKPEQQELDRLRKEVAKLKAGRDILNMRRKTNMRDDQFLCPFKIAIERGFHQRRVRINRLGLM